MGPQDASAGQACPDSLYFQGAYCLAYTASEQSQNAWCAHNRNSRLGREANKNISGKKRAFEIDYPIGPFGTH
jgi:hypothetical protein